MFTIPLLPPPYMFFPSSAPVTVKEWLMVMALVAALCVLLFWLIAALLKYVD
jgi:hypothetical protein